MTRDAWELGHGCVHRHDNNLLYTTPVPSSKPCCTPAPNVAITARLGHITSGPTNPVFLRDWFNVNPTNPTHACPQVAFMYVVGASTLLNDLPGPAARALDLFQRLACKQLLQTRPPPRRRSDTSTLLGLASDALSTTNLGAYANAHANAAAAAAFGAAGEAAGAGGPLPQAPPPPPEAWSGLPAVCSRAGYLVEGGEGLVLAVFRDPTAAVEWALDCVEALKKQVCAGFWGV